MPAQALETFHHPKKAYHLQFPAQWEHRVQEEGMSCGFGPRERDNVGLWISILPYCVDTDRVVEELPKFFDMALQHIEAGNVRRDESLRHYALKADSTKTGDGSNFWIVAAGDLVLFASSQVPFAEREVWNPQFDAVMASLAITRDKELQWVKIATSVLRKLRDLYPDQDYTMEDRAIHGRDHRISLDNLYREIREVPGEQEQLIDRFVQAMSPAQHAKMGHETWPEIAHRIVPILKPRNYVREDGTTRHMMFQEWLADVIICYAISGDNTIRFITGWDRDRWEVTDEKIHAKAIRNLTSLDWPRRLEGVKQPGGGRLILVTTGDGLAASRLLHPELHRLMSGPLGSPFYAAIPDRDTLVVMSHHGQLRRRTARTVRKDYKKSAYQISPRLFLVTPDGIAPAPEDE